MIVDHKEHCAVTVACGQLSRSGARLERLLNAVKMENRVAQWPRCDKSRLVVAGFGSEGIARDTIRP